MWKFTSALLAAGLAAILLGTPAAADEPSWRSYTTADGLPSNRVLAVAQILDGTLWVGTEAGLSHFFDRRFLPDASMPLNVSQAYIHALLATGDGALWVATNVGLYRRNADGEWVQQLEQQAGLATRNISALLQASDNAVWVGGMDGLARWDGNAWLIVPIEGIAPRVVALAEDAEGRLWVAEPTRIEILKAGQVVKMIGAKDGLPLGTDFTALLRDAGGDIWGATTVGLAHFTGLTLLHVYTEGSGLGNNSVQALLEDSSHGLWVGTAFGVSHLVEGALQRNLTSADGLANDQVRVLFRDHEGYLWVGTDDGLTRLPLDSWAVESDPLLNRAAIKSLLLNGPEGVYVAVPSGVAHQVQDGTWKLITEGFSGQAVYALARDSSGHIWVGTDAGLARLEGERFIPDPIVSLSTTVNALLTDRAGALWVGTTNGLVRLVNQATVSYTKAGGELGQDSVQALWETKTGDIWAGTQGGASRFRQGTWLTISYQSTHGGLANDIVRAGLEDSAGNLWFGTNRGLSRLRAGAMPTDQFAWHTFVTPQLADNNVNALWEDRNSPGHIWAGTSGGLSLIAGDEVSTFGHQDGLSHKQIRALGQGSDGTLWIGTALGLTYHQDHHQTPQIVPLALLVDNKVCDTSCQAGAPYKSRTATFQYDGSDLANLDGLRYEYDIVSVDDSTKIHLVHELTAAAAIPVDLMPGATFTVTVTALGRDFSESQTIKLPGLRVNAPTALQRIQDWPWSPYVALAAVLIAGPASIFGYILWRRRRRYGYRDLQLTVQPTGISGTHQVKLSVSRGPSLHDYERPINSTLLQPLLAHLSDDTTNDLELRYLGELLYSALLSDDATAHLKQHFGLGRNGIRLRLHFENAAQLEALPWELLNGGDRLKFLTVQSHLALVRDLSPEPYEAPPRTRLPLKLLIAWATPQDLPPLDVAKEVVDIQEAIAGLVARGRIDVQILEHADSETFKQAVRAGQDLIHFIGHGGVKDGTGVLYVEDVDHDSESMNQAELTALLAEAPTFTDKVPKLLVINACRTADRGDQEGLMGLAAGLVSAGGPLAVVGMGYRITTRSAAIFSRALYETLVRHGQIDYAVAEGRVALFAEVGAAKRDWGVPRLYTRTPEAVIFELT